MKKYHEVGVIMDGCEKYGYVIKQGSPADEAPYLIAKTDAFERAVQRDEVQYFKWDGKEAIVEYTPEELEPLRMLGVIPYTDKAYDDHDMHYQRKYVDAVADDGMILLMPVKAINILAIGNIILFTMFFPKEKHEVVNDYLYSWLSGTMWMNTLKIASNNASFSVCEAMLMDDGMINESVNDIIVDTANLERLNKDLMVQQAGVKQPDGDMVRKYADYLDAKNCSVLDRYR